MASLQLCVNPKTHFAIVPGSGKRDASGSLVTYIHFLTHPVSRGKPFQGRKCELENVPRINCCVFLFLDNQQKQGVHMGVHQEFAGCLVRLGGDAAYRPAGGYVGGRAAAPWAGAGGAEPRAPALPARLVFPDGPVPFYPEQGMYYLKYLRANYMTTHLT